MSRRQLTAIVMATGAVVLLRFVFGPFSLHGLLFVFVTAIAAWLLGPGPATVSTALGFFAAHVQLFIEYPILFSTPRLMWNRRYFTGFGVYLLLSGILILVSRRHYRIVNQLDRE